MTIKNAEEAKKSERPKIFQKHLEFIVNSMQSLVNLRSFLRWRWQWASIGHFVFLLSPRLMDQQIVISTLYHPSLPNVQWRLSIVTHCNLWLFIYPCILFTSTKHLRTNILTSGSVFPLYPSLRYTYIAHCFWQWFKNQISEIRFKKSDFRNRISEILFPKSDFRHHCKRCPKLTDSRTFTESKFEFSVPPFFFP